jgi:hypothetical protein
MLNSDPRRPEKNREKNFLSPGHHLFAWLRTPSLRFVLLCWEIQHITRDGTLKLAKLVYNYSIQIQQTRKTSLSHNISQQHITHPLPSHIFPCWTPRAMSWFHAQIRPDLHGSHRDSSDAIGDAGRQQADHVLSLLLGASESWEFPEDFNGLHRHTWWIMWWILWWYVEFGFDGISYVWGLQWKRRGGGIYGRTRSWRQI